MTDDNGNGASMAAADPNNGPINTPDPAPGLATDIPEPELPQLQQRPTPIYPAVDVKVVAPVQVQLQPATTTSIRVEFIAANADAVQVLNRDLRRQRAVLLFSGAVFLGAAKAKIRKGAATPGVPWVASTPLEIHSTTELYVFATAADVTVSVVEEFYAD